MLFRIPPSNGLPVSHGGQLRSLLWLGGDDGEVWGGGVLVGSECGKSEPNGTRPRGRGRQRGVNVALSCSGKCRFKKKKQPKENKAKLKRRVRADPPGLQCANDEWSSHSRPAGRPLRPLCTSNKTHGGPTPANLWLPPSPPLYSSSPHYRFFFIAARVKQHMSGRRWCAVAEMSAARRRRVP